MSSVVPSQSRAVGGNEAKVALALVLGALGTLPLQDRRFVIGVSFVAAGLALLSLRR